MSIECGECEHDLRGGHAEECSRRKRGQSLDAVFALLEPLSYEERQRVLKAAAAHWPPVPSAEADPARLTPSGKVAEDVATLQHALFTTAGEPRHHDALSRLAAQAQGYAAMKAESAARLALADMWKGRAKSLEAERDAAVADNAALMQEAKRASHHWKTMAEMEAGDPGPVHRADCAHCVIVNAPHPGAALLAEHAKALVRARNEGREEAARWHDAKGDVERKWLDANEHLPNRPTIEAHRSFLECHRSSANAIRAMKESES